MNTEFVILNEVKNPRVAGGRDHGFFTSFRMTGNGQAVHLFPNANRATVCSVFSQSPVGEVTRYARRPGTPHNRAAPKNYFGPVAVGGA
jgi:hypothetical protein